MGLFTHFYVFAQQSCRSSLHGTNADNWLRTSRKVVNANSDIARPLASSTLRLARGFLLLSVCFDEVVDCSPAIQKWWQLHLKPP